MGTHLPAKPVAELPPRKPMAAVRRVSLFEREVRIGLSSAAIEILFDLASVLSEGAREPDGYFGSTMITIELARAAALVSDPCDASTVRRLAELVATDPRVHERARALAAAEANRLAGSSLRRAQFDLRVRESGRHLHIDVELEARWAAAGSCSEVTPPDPPPVPPPVPPSGSASALPAGPPEGPPSGSASALPAGPPEGPPSGNAIGRTAGPRAGRAEEA